MAVEHYLRDSTAEIHPQTGFNGQEMLIGINTSPYDPHRFISE